MNILGLFAPGPNPSAALLRDGNLVAWAEEERFNRIKTSPNNYPIRAAGFCLQQAGITLDEVDGIAYAWDCPRYAREAPQFFREAREQQADQDNSVAALQEELLVNLYHPDRIRHSLHLGLRHLSGRNQLPDIHYFPHHLCHAASALYCSGFDDANILALDGSGEEVTTLLCQGNGLDIQEVHRFLLPHTLGGFYATFTEYCGFRPYMDEGKLMGLASYGSYDQEIQDKLDHVITYDKQTGFFQVNPDMRYCGRHSYGNRFTDEFVELFGLPKAKHQTAMDAPFPDIAFAAQWRLEQIVLGLARYLHRATGLRRLCLAGGVAMNCVMNGKLTELDEIDEVFVQPAASDNGVSLGAALLLSREKGLNPRSRLSHMYWGPEFSDDEIETHLKAAKVPYRKSDSVTEETADYLHQGKIIGWFQGRMEVGARALGGRSILANPVFPDMKDRLNAEVKHREGWRPFCPSFKEESYNKIIDTDHDSPYMIMAFPVFQQYHELIPSCVHVDGTARPQVVKKNVNPRFWQLLDEVEQRTGYGVLINTSFNVQGEPIVCTPSDAIRCFFSTGIDVLVIGNWIIDKSEITLQKTVALDVVAGD